MEGSDRRIGSRVVKRVVRLEIEHALVVCRQGGGVPCAYECDVVRKAFRCADVAEVGVQEDGTLLTDGSNPENPRHYFLPLHMAIPSPARHSFQRSTLCKPMLHVVSRFPPR